MIQPEELKQVPIFACLTDGQRERIAQNAADLRVQKGRVAHPRRRGSFVFCPA